MFLKGATVNSGRPKNLNRQLVHLRLDKPALRVIDKLAVERDTSRAHIVREAVNKFVDMRELGLTR